MTRRLLAVVLIAATISVAQGSLLYAATIAPAGAPAGSDLAPAGAMASFALSAEDVTDAALGCLRGAGFCFGYGTWNCCGELAAALAIAGAVGAWAAAGLAAWGYWYYC
ncbi:MAG TPA: hypothetical protein VNI78_08150 [Vicinamibacterales bacterium]|nr:hypothetical protein [Vicinamibacterales bacterium]